MPQANLPPRWPVHDRPAQCEREHDTDCGRPRRGWAVVLASVWLALGMSLSAQTPMRIEQVILPWTTGDGAAGDGFGIALAQQGDWLAIGAWGKVVSVPGVLNGLAQGSVYLYRRNGGDWIPAQDLQLPVNSADANFGGALALRGDALLIAAPRVTVDGQVEAGQVYLYRDDGLGQWLLEATIDSPAAEVDGRFGTALVWLDDQRFAVGAARESDRGQAGAGRVHVYQQGSSGWTLAQTLIPASPEADARFGSALLIADEGLLVGVPQAGLNDRGAVDRYSLPGLVALPQVPSPLNPGAQFGAALAAVDGLVAVGAPQATAGGQFGAGQVVLYPSGLGEAPGQVLEASPPEGQARFGQALVLHSDRLHVGEPQADIGIRLDEGEVHVYPLTQGMAGAPLSLSASSPGLSGRLGTALAVDSDGSVLAGADLDQVGPNGQGSVQRFAVAGAGFDPPQRIDRGDGAYLERFGSAVAIDGQWALAGSFLERTEAGAEAGAVYVHRLVDGQWQRFQRLLSPDPATEQRFGVAVAVDGDRLAVGAYWDAASGTIDAGAAYVYHYDGSQWLLEQALRAPLPETEGFYGFSLALSEDRLLVGAPGSNLGGVGEGAGFLYLRQSGSWQLEQTLLLPDLEISAQYGTRVALAGGRALLGAPAATSSGLAGAGAVALFRQAGGWSFDTRLQAELPMEGAAFGSSLALGEDLMVIAASTDSVAATTAGALHLFPDSGPGQVLTASDALPGDRLGSSLALSGPVLLAGAPGVDIADRASQGALYRWRRVGGQWQPDPRLLVAAGQALDGFGLATAADGEWAMVAAPFHAGISPQEGEVHAVVVGVLFADGFE